MEALSEPVMGPVVPPVESKPTPAPVKARPRSTKAEPLSPFMPWSVEERAPLPEAEVPAQDTPYLLAELLREPAAVTERLVDPVRLQGLVLGSVGVIAGGTSFFAAAASVARGQTAWWLPAAITSLNVLMALAASLGPIYAASILLATRVPLARLVASLLAAMATGALLLAGMAPPLYLVWRLDSEWGGPLLLLSAFLLSGWAAGARMHRLLNLMAERVTRAALGNESARLSEEDAFRVGILARVSWMVLAFSLGLGFWAFKALG